VLVKWVEVSTPQEADTSVKPRESLPTAIQTALSISGHPTRLAFAAQVVRVEDGALDSAHASTVTTISKPAAVGDTSVTLTLFSLGATASATLRVENTTSESADALAIPVIRVIATIEYAFVLFSLLSKWTLASLVGGVVVGPVNETDALVSAGECLSATINDALVIFDLSTRWALARFVVRVEVGAIHPANALSIFWECVFPASGRSAIRLVVTADKVIDALWITGVEVSIVANVEVPGFQVFQIHIRIWDGKYSLEKENTSNEEMFGEHVESLYGVDMV
jgi:hypothetical protein